MLLPLLPAQCADLFRERGIPLRQWNPGSEEVAFDREASLKVLEALGGSEIAVLGGDVVRLIQGRLKYVHQDWTCNRSAGESPRDYVNRSQLVACEYIRKFRPAEGYEPLFVLVLAALAGEATTRP